MFMSLGWVLSSSSMGAPTAGRFAGSGLLRLDFLPDDLGQVRLVEPLIGDQLGRQQLGIPFEALEPFIGD
jgi:hypothetical protein